jgi:excisionase family DNA binding protein
VSNAGELSVRQPISDLHDTQPLRFEIGEAARMLRFSRSTLYARIRAGEISAQRDGRRRYITAAELQRYVSLRTEQIRSATCMAPGVIAARRYRAY